MVSFRINQARIAAEIGSPNRLSDTEVAGRYLSAQL
jgi:hypothetical protein